MNRFTISAPAVILASGFGMGIALCALMVPLLSM